MATEESSTDVRVKLFDEIIESLKEYSTEEIEDPETIKEEIVELLTTHRPIKLSDYEYGLSKNSQPNKRLIVKEAEDETKVKEYLNISDSWRCSNAYSQKNKCKSSNLQIQYGIVFAPNDHIESCETKDYAFVMEIQDLLKQGKTKEAHGLICRGKRSRTSISNRSTSALNESTSSLPEEMDTSVVEPSTIERPASENTTTTVDDSNPTSPSPDTAADAVAAVNESTTSIAKRELDDDEEDSKILEPVPKKRKVVKKEPIVKAEPFEFEQPSSITLKQICKKLKIEYNCTAYQLWGNMIFDKILPVAKKFQKHSFKSQNIFACLSLLFSGKNSSCFLIQHAINEAFRQDLIKSGTKTKDETEQIFITEFASDEQIEFIAKFLGCRIGIYYGKTLKKFGKWNKKDADVLTLILSFDAGVFAIVLDLQ